MLGLLSYVDSNTEELDFSTLMSSASSVAALEGQSMAAVNAIAALQRRIRELEEEEKTLLKEIERLNQQISINDEGYQKREKELAIVQERAKVKMSEAEEAWKNIKNIDSQNTELRDKIKNISHQIDGAARSTTSSKSSTFSAKKILDYDKKLLKDYESLLPMIFEPPSLLGETPIRTTKIMGNLDLLPPRIRKEAKLLSELPGDYGKQKIPIKRQIIKSLLRSRDEAVRLSNSIHKIEAKASTAPKSDERDLREKVTQFNTLTYLMNKFNFS